MTRSIPVIDLGPFRVGNPGVGDGVAAQLNEALRTLGFAVIGGRGPDPGIGDALQPPPCASSIGPCPRRCWSAGREMTRTAATFRSARRHWCEWRAGKAPGRQGSVRGRSGRVARDDPYFTGPASYPCFAPNLWPDAPCDLRARMRAYWAGMEDLMRTVAAAIARGIGMPDDTFDDLLGPAHTSQLRLLHYPPVDRPLEPGQLRAGEHTDVGMMTILRNDPAPGGLQVRGTEGEWIDAPAIADTWILNIGDLLMRWTNDRLRSTPHRVVVPPADAGSRSRRLSIGFFVGPRYDAVVSCLPSCHDASDPVRYPPVTVHDYRTARFAAGAGDNRPFEAA